MKLLYVLLTQRTPRLASQAYYYGLEFYHGKEFEMMLIYIDDDISVSDGYSAINYNQNPKGNHLLFYINHYFDFKPQLYSE